MELKNYITIVLKNIPTVIAISILGAFCGFFTVKTFFQGYRLEQWFYLASQTPAQTSQEAFYSYQNARNFTDTVVSLLSSPLYTNPSVRKVGPQVVKVTISAADPGEASAQAAKVTEKINRHLADLGVQAFTLKTLGTQSPTKVAPDAKLATVVGFLAGFVFANLVIALKTYLKL